MQSHFVGVKATCRSLMHLYIYVISRTLQPVDKSLCFLLQFEPVNFIMDKSICKSGKQKGSFFIPISGGMEDYMLDYDSEKQIELLNKKILELERALENAKEENQAKSSFCPICLTTSAHR